MSYRDYKEQHYANGYVPIRKDSRQSMSRLLNNLENFSYIMVSASRQELSKKENQARFKLLKTFVNEEGFSFIPVKGSYVEEHTNEVGFEDSLIIFPIGKNKKIKTDEELFKFGLSLIQIDEDQQDEIGNFIGDPTNVISFGQDAFLFKGEDQVPKYYDKEGNLIMSFKGGKDINNFISDYFTQLVKSQGTDLNRFTFKESWVSAYPQSAQNQHLRRH